MTVHKSKGLEYDTVIFMGLDDSAWWSYSSANPEGKATFSLDFRVQSSESCSPMQEGPAAVPRFLSCTNF